VPRPRSFDETEALDAAVACFWRRGLDATSVRDLAAEMGLNCPSLYNAFDDKRALFAQALERYATRFLRERIRRLEQHASPKAAIHAYVEEVIARSLSAQAA
jgi:TetR/AcrR family transcriptional regulator, transcriptional repressor for nem operon